MKFWLTWFQAYRNHKGAKMLNRVLSRIANRMCDPITLEQYHALRSARNIVLDCLMTVDPTDIFCQPCIRKFLKEL